MNRFALDTNVLSEGARPRPDAKLMRRLNAAEGVAVVPAPCWHELLYGVRRLPSGARRNALEEFVQSIPARFPVLPYSADAAAWHADERARLEATGQVRSFVDGQIAAIATTQNLVLISRNLTDFQGYRGLRVESWWSGDS